MTAPPTPGHAWILLTLGCAFVQSLWMALSKRGLQHLPPTRFMLYFRAPVVVATAPMLLLWTFPSVGLAFWGLVLLCAAVECVRLVAFAVGTKHDYYATYSLKNMAPVFVLLLAPSVLKEKITWPVIAGAASVVTGGFIFYRAGRFTLAGVLAALAQGGATVLCRRGFAYCQSPLQFVVPMYAVSTAMLLFMESARAGRASSAGFAAGMRETACGFKAALRGLLPLSALNVAAVLTFVYGLDLAPAATHFSILFRTSLIFGFILSLVLLREYERWRAKLCGAAFILLGAILIALSAR